MDKYCTIYLVRHGESVANASGVIGGQKDFDLTEQGKIQAIELSLELENINFDAIFSSDLIRAKKTAEIIAEEKKVTVLATKFLKEKSSGKFEGEISDELKDEYKKLKQIVSELSPEDQFKYRIDENAETDEELMARFIPFIREIAIAYLGKTVLMVTHAHIIRTFLNTVGFVKDHLSKEFHIKNTAYLKIYSDGVDFEMVDLKGIS